MRTVLTLLAINGMVATAKAGGVGAIDPELAVQYFEEAQAISRKDNGSLWGTPLYGPLLFVDPETHTAVANQADKQGRLIREGKVFEGKLPPEVNVANTAIEWAGVNWTMISWPLPEDPEKRARLMMHECFHRIQERLGLTSATPTNAHLESRNGRVWLQLEWRALELALDEDGFQRSQALEDALLFRAYRQSLFPKTAEEECELEMNEGLAEYTGVKLSTRSLSEMLVVAACDLRQARGRQTLSRSFAYVSGPAYGALLDSSGVDWRSWLKADSDFASLIAKAYRVESATPSSRQALKRARAYQGDYVMTVETEREKFHRQRVTRQRERFLGNSALTLPIGKTFSYSFDPNQVIPLDDSHTVYLNARVTDDWGTLEAPSGVLVVREGGRVVRLQVPAPREPMARPLKGDGWTLEPETGWQIVPGGRAGDYLLRRQPQPD